MTLPSGRGPLEPTPRTPAGRRLAEVAEALAIDFATRAGDHDREASYPFENVAALREAGFFRAPIPQELGGLGVESVHDLLIASSRLARGDASVAIGLNMHFLPVLSMARRYRVAEREDDARRLAGFGESLARIVRDGVVMAAAVSEPGQDMTRPATRARRTEDGWTVEGRKIFCTMSPAATLLYAAVTVEDGDEERYAYAQIPADTPGVVVHDDWDAMGMRASGSNSVSFEGVRLPDAAVRGGFPAGRLTADFMERNLNAGAFHAAAAVGIAEAAHRYALDGLSRRPAADVGAWARMQVAANVVDLGAVRAQLTESGRLLDRFHSGEEPMPETTAEMAPAFAQIQAAKAFVNEAAVRIVDRAMALSGGAGYMSRHPLSRAYRDVRAGAFMHPLGANRAHEFVAQVALGEDPDLH
jgi:alkylation response protein AidB-like acyl-CoA dehydrogenase